MGSDRILPSQHTIAAVFLGAAPCEIQVLSFVTAPRLSVPVSFHSPANGGVLPDAGG